MSYPAQYDVDVRDGQLGLAGSPTNLPLVIGGSSLGSAATLYVEPDPNDALDELGFGPLTELGMQMPGGFLALKLATSVAAANTAVTPVRIGTSVGTITVSGSALRDYRARVRIKETTEALGSGKFDYSLDNGNTYSEEITIPTGGTYTMPDSGLTLTFTLQTGTPDFESGDYFTFSSTCAHWNTTNLSAGLTALLDSPYLIGRKIQKVYFTGIPALATDAATNFAGMAVFMAALENLDHFARGMMDCGSLDTTANVLANFVASVSDTRLAACYGRCEMPSPAAIPGYGLPFVSVMNPIAVRATVAEMSENLGRVLSGPLTGVKATTLSQDEERDTAFTEDNKINTLRTNRNKPGGAYSTNGFLKSPTGSDFQFWDYGVTLDRACEALVAGLANWTLAKLQALTDGSGFMDPRSAATVKKSIDPSLGSLMKGPTKDGLDKHVSGQELIIATAYNFLSERVIKATYRMVPTVPVEGGTITVGLVRALEAA